jgi:hypothetical protein
MSAPKQIPLKQITTPETFILESLTLADEASERRDGKLLFEQLRLQGRNPRYYYFRTAEELRHLAVEYRNSGYRYLHLSCHGNETTLQFTFGAMSFAEFAQTFEKRIDNRRLFISGCSLGNRSFADTVYATNGGMYSIIAPTTAVRFDQSAVFWTSFYYLMHSVDEESMKWPQVEEALRRLSELFEVSVAFFRKKGSEVIEARFERPAVPVLWDATKGLAQAP